MPSLQERDKILRESWRDARFISPDPHPAGEHFAVQVWGIIDDPRYRLNREEKPFQDVVSYWPAAKKFTVTHLNRSVAGEDVADFPVVVTFWQPLPPMPW